MHSKWEELIPLYVAGMLIGEERFALERHLGQCENCQRVLEDWRTTAAVVKEAASEWSRGLPPLSPKLRAQIAARSTSQNGSGAHFAPTDKIIPVTPMQPPAQAAVARQHSARRLPVTLAAAVLTLVFLGSGILFMATRPQPPQDEVAFGATSTADQIADLTQQAEVESTSTPRPTSDDIGIIAVPSTQPPITRSPIPPPNNTPIVPTQPVGSGGGGGDPTQDVEMEIGTFLIPGMTSTPDPLFGFSTPPEGVCLVLAANNQPAPIYQWPGTQFPILGYLQPGDAVNTNVTDGSGWFEVWRFDEGLLGWVNGVNVILQGTTCSSLMLPTPTLSNSQSSTGQTCFVSNPTSAVVPVRAAPSAAADVVDNFEAGQTLTAFARTPDGWLLVEFQLGGAVFSGWVDVATSGLMTSGDCASLGG